MKREIAEVQREIAEGNIDNLSAQHSPEGRLARAYRDSDEGLDVVAGHGAPEQILTPVADAICTTPALRTRAGEIIAHIADIAGDSGIEAVISGNPSIKNALERMVRSDPDRRRIYDILAGAEKDRYLAHFFRKGKAAEKMNELIEQASDPAQLAEGTASERLRAAKTELSSARRERDAVEKELAEVEAEITALNVELASFIAGAGGGGAATGEIISARADRASAKAKIAALERRIGVIDENYLKQLTEGIISNTMSPITVGGHIGYPNLRAGANTREKALHKVYKRMIADYKKERKGLVKELQRAARKSREGRDKADLLEGRKEEIVVQLETARKRRGELGETKRALDIEVITANGKVTSVKAEQSLEQAKLLDRLNGIIIEGFAEGMNQEIGELKDLSENVKRVETEDLVRQADAAIASEFVDARGRINWRQWQIRYQEALGSNPESVLQHMLSTAGIDYDRLRLESPDKYKELIVKLRDEMVRLRKAKPKEFGIRIPGTRSKFGEHEATILTRWYSDEEFKNIMMKPSVAKALIDAGAGDVLNSTTRIGEKLRGLDLKKLLAILAAMGIITGVGAVATPFLLY